MASRLTMGVRFHPTDAELIIYLKRFLNGHLNLLGPVQLTDIYGDHPPWVMFGTSKEKLRYFITKLRKRKQSNKRFIRKAGNGSWSGQTSGDPIRDGKGAVVGFRKSFIYESRADPAQNKIWLMREYSVGDDFFKENGIPKQDVVLCRIKRNVKENIVKNVVPMREQDALEIIKLLLGGGPLVQEEQVVIPNNALVMRTEETEDQERANSCTQLIAAADHPTTSNGADHQNTGYFPGTMKGIEGIFQDDYHNFSEAINGTAQHDWYNPQPLFSRNLSIGGATYTY